MINISEVIETNAMIEKENLDVRTITLGISLIDCISSDLDELCRRIYERIRKHLRQLSCHLLRSRRHSIEDLRTIEELGSHDEPEFLSVHMKLLGSGCMHPVLPSADPCKWNQLIS